MDIGANQTGTVDLTAWVNQLQNKPANTTLNKGILITSTTDVTAYYEVVSGCNCNPEIFSLKGKNALGNQFFISSQFSFSESTSYAATNAFDIVATKDNTLIKITPSKAIIGHAANVPFTITLNRGQTFSAQAVGIGPDDHLQGSYVESDKPIAITIKDDLVQISSCADLIGDQTVPTSVLGTQYVVTQGYLTPFGSGQIFDYIYVTATEDNTSIFLDGQPTPSAVLQKGNSAFFTLQNPSVYISSTKKIYVYHLSGNGCEAGSAMIPKLNCTGSRSVSVVRSKNTLFAVMITTKNGNQGNFSVNGNSGLINALNFTPVQGTNGEYVTARIDLSAAVAVNVPINFSNSSGNFSLGFINGGVDNGTSYGYFSDYKSSNVQSSTLDICPSGTAQLSAYGGVTYKWTPATGLDNPNIANPKASPAATTDYKVEIITAEGCVDSAKVKVVVSNSGAATPASVSITANTNNICAGTAINFTATPTNGGTAPMYQWQVNGVNVGANSSAFSSSSLVNGDKVNCLMTSNAPCATPTQATSNVITVSVTSAQTAITISASQPDNCPRTPIVFTAATTGAGTSPSYQWKVNNVNVGVNSPTYSSNTISNGDKVVCTLISNAPCAGVTPIVSNELTINLNSASPLSVSITASQNNACAGTLIKFSAVAINAGTAPSYQWKINGTNSGLNSADFETNSLNNGDKVTCVVTSNAVCSLNGTAISNEIIAAVKFNLPLGVNIKESDNNVCAGTLVNFTAITVNAGNTPTYQWQINGVDVGANSSTFSSSSLLNGDMVTCKVTGSEECALPAYAVSNVITMNVTPQLQPSVIISASNTNVCAGGLVNFVAVTNNSGTAPVYQWKINGVPTGTNSNIFSSNNLVNGDKVTCTVTSNALCTTPVTVDSNEIIISVNSDVAAVSITASQNNICPGSLVTFTVSVTGGGSLPVYQWKVNGLNAGNNSPTFAGAGFNNGDKVTCTVTSNAPCAVTPTATSNQITISTISYVTPSVTITQTNAIICQGDVANFAATVSNAGINPSYQWKLNGNNVGNNASTLAIGPLLNADVVQCIVVSNGVCTLNPIANSNIITVVVNRPATPSVTITSSDNNICAGNSVSFSATVQHAGNNPAYQWLVNDKPVGSNNSFYQTKTLLNGDLVRCRLTNPDHCVLPAIVESNVVTMLVNQLPSVNAGSDQVIEKGATVKLSAVASGDIDEVTWSPAIGLSNNKILNPVANPSSTTVYRLSVRTINGCINEDEVKVTVLINLIIPNSFSPNGDGINDYWVIKNLSDYPRASIEIFTRWGQNVYRASQSSQPWDGTFNGKQLPAGVYYYVIHLDNNTAATTGNITLIR
ncbi:T9SS type B sorting domain-containing protein [Mucilaginibacter achroorhodeus]|nr:gliding motility-associated C-terminal domain-containing protein [Mucilaginibacter achroorhodeus]